MLQNLTSVDHFICDDSLSETLRELVDTPSPTGEEAELAGKIAERLHRYGVASETQFLTPTQANAIGSIRSPSGGTSLLLFASIDTVTSNNAEEDIPWAAPEMRQDMRAKSWQREGHIFGLGAHAPKGFAACILEAVRVLKAMGVTLRGDLFVGFGAGGMPTHSRPGMPPHTGHGIGCEHLIKSLPLVDGAIVPASGTSVTWEDFGSLWFEVSVSGKHTYSGARHLLPSDNAITSAAKLILKLEDWFEDYGARHASEFCRQQGTVSQISAGWQRMPAFTSECARFQVDLRFSPDQSPLDVEREFAETLERYSAELNIQTGHRRSHLINASRTPFKDPIIQNTISVWEALNNRAHETTEIMSFATDANILRGLGVPTARIGLAQADLPNRDFVRGLNCVSLHALRQLTKFLTLSTLEYLGGSMESV